MDNSEKVIKRINLAVSAGVKIAVIAEQSGITYYRMASTVNTKAYRQSTTFDESEVNSINDALDSIIDAFKG